MRLNSHCIYLIVNLGLSITTNPSFRVSYLSYFITADEGDMDGGSRGFTIFNKMGEVVWGSGSELDQIAASLGHYPESRSGNKGSEPENVSIGTFGGKKLAFINGERSNLVFVYDISNIKKPKYVQALPTSVGPEGSLTIPSRGLMITACEVDSRDDKIRSTLSIYQYGFDEPAYPTLMSERGRSGVAIPWSAMSGLSPGKGHNLYAVEDSYYAKSRFFKISTKDYPYIVEKATRIVDKDDIFANFNVDNDVADGFGADELGAMINSDKTVNIDPEGIALDDDGYFWIASEGSGSYGSAERLK